MAAPARVATWLAVWLLAALAVWPPGAPAAALYCANLGSAAGIRVNKCLRATHSRRAADRLIDEGRVQVNGDVAQAGARVDRGDVVKLDGRVVEWERLNPPQTADADGVASPEPAAPSPVRGASATPVAAPPPFVYVKYWKPRGVECTTDRRRRNNIIDRVGALPGVRDRIFPVGRLDVDSTGLILLTSDGQLVNRLLRAREAKRKEYVVTTDRRASDAQIARLASGVTITTVAQRDGTAKTLTAPTLPCTVERAETRAEPKRLRFVLTEGRNRQIRRMCTAVGLEVVRLHRTGFAGLTLGGCARPGEWAWLRADELARIGVSGAISEATESEADTASRQRAPRDSISHSADGGAVGRRATRGDTPGREGGERRVSARRSARPARPPRGHFGQ